MRRILCLIILFVPILASGRQSSTPAPSGADHVRSEMLVSTSWLADHLNDPNVVILHVTDGVGDYKRGHIPGARFLAMNKITTNNGPVHVELPSVEVLQQTFGELGIGDNTRVVLYATNWFPNAARAYYTLDYLGHGDKAALLDGGIEEWLAEQRPVTGDIPKFSSATFTPHVHENVRALLAEVKSDVDAKPGEEAEQIVDSRPAGRYDAGHLSGATNIYWQDTLVSEDHPVFQSPEKLRALFASRGVVPGKKIITYCEVGLQASHGYFLAKYLGYDAAMYDGSYQEWSSKNLPVVKGDAKR
ncbi:MAG TPA: sulfurtransferase [Candidatus Methylomirabilis sp.]|nr:sulfurtransferase [Candidatus Methylomirabilis sp.]